MYDLRRCDAPQPDGAPGRAAAGSEPRAVAGGRGRRGARGGRGGTRLAGHVVASVAVARRVPLRARH